MYKVYVLYSKSFKRFYTGFTQDLEKRLGEHNSGKTKSTKGFIPWEIVYSEECESRMKARNREKYYKSGIGREKIKEILKENLKDL